ncbi:UNVERIFIED_CONTAM: hypothetical protein Scaly_1625700 [Sesamum calycinum]|uniref:Uncharacterized protein n=1 Tax=Sesamum calycinum TaxID=2727403 RepID=A0AAW2P8K5_9LAMI
MTNDKRWLKLKELQEKEYPFPDSDVPYIFNELLERTLIELPESKRLDEFGRVNDPKYCKYHRVVSHSIKRSSPKATPMENNNENLSETTKDEAPTSAEHETKKLPYSSVFRYVVPSNDKGK